MTGSHNPPEYNGLKMMIGGITLFADQIQGILGPHPERGLAHGRGAGHDPP